MSDRPTRTARRAHQEATADFCVALDQYADLLESDAAEPVPSELIAAQIAANETAARYRTEYALAGIDYHVVPHRPFGVQTWRLPRVINR